MAGKPMPPENGPERLRWYEEADRETREPHAVDSFHAFEGAPEFWWHKTKISEEEFRANADKQSGACADLEVTTNIEEFRQLTHEYPRWADKAKTEEERRAVRDMTANIRYQALLDDRV
jgi:hypothetical protein